MKVLIVEDHFLARYGLRGLVGDQADMTVVGEVSRGDLVLDAFERLRPDVVLMDLALPGADGLAVTASLVQRFSDARVLIVTNSDGGALIARALDAGALGYVRKDIEGETLIEAIRAVARGDSEKPYLPPDLARQLAQERAEPALNKRETEVLELLARGRSNQEIAVMLSISPGTTRIYVSRILGKLNVASRTEAVALARERGLLGPGQAR